MKVAVRAKVPRREDESARGEVRLPPVVATALATPGEPLAADVRSEMEQRLGHDFADVRVHADARAAAAAHALDSVAFTSGADIVFAPGRYPPHDHEGRRLLAHELVHTLQQRGTRAAAGVQVSAPVVATTDPLEAEAAAVSTRVAAGETVPRGAVSVGVPEARGMIARQAREAIARAPVEVPDSADATRAVADDVARLLAFDPDDVFGRVRRRLARLAPATREAVANAVRGRVPAPAAGRVAAILAELRPPGVGPPPTAEAAPPTTAEAAPARDGDRAGAPAAVREPVALTERPAEQREDESPPEPIELEASAVPRVAEAEQPPEDLAAEAVAGLMAPPDPAGAPAPEREEAVPADKEEAPAPPSGGDSESSEPADAVDPRIDQVAAADHEDSEDEAAAAEAAAPVPTSETPSDESAAPQESVAEPQAPAPTAGGPEIEPADADAGAGAPPPGEVQETVAESALADTEGTDSEPEPEPADAGSGGGAVLAAEPDSPEQPGTEPAADPAAGTVELGSLAEVEPEEDAADAGGDTGAGGAPIAEPPAPDTPDVGGGEPESAIEMVAALPPTVAAATLDGVKAAATRTVAGQRGELVASPPQLERPTGAPSAAEVAAETPTVPVGAARVERAPVGASFPIPAPRPLPPTPAPPTAAVRTPQLGGSGDHVTESDLAAIRGAVKALPTTDPALAVTAGAPPPLELKGDADPARTGEQRAELDKATVSARTQGAADAAAPMGEAAVLPRVAPETLRAAIGSASAPAVAAPPPAGLSEPDPAIDAIVRERRPGELRAAAVAARGQMTAERQKQAQATEAAHAESRANIEKEIAGNAAEQRRERDDVRTEAREQRQQWNTAQKDLVEASRQDADKAATKAATDVAAEREKGTAAADTHIAAGNVAVTAARENAEREATEAQRKGEEEPTGFLGWVASEAKAFFDSIKTAIKGAFEAARAAVKQAIETAQKLAAEAIDTARKAIVAAVKAAGDRLIEIGDRVLGDFPRLRDKFRGAIRATVSAAQKAVDALAEGLKAGVKAYLDLYAAALDGILGLLQTGLLAVVDGYAAVVQGAIKAAQVVANGLGDLLQVARDVASGPRAWLRNLGAAIVDGVRNHLWAALKLAVSGWFNAKLDAILGLGKLIWNVLAKGGITLAAVAKMAFAALKKVIPIALIKLLITKLVGMLVPAAAAVMAIIEGLQAAWGAAGHILGAIKKFIVFLKAVKGGNAGPQFAEAVAAAAVAVIEFVSFWLLRKLLKPAAAVGRAIKRVAAKIAAQLRRLVQALKRGVKKLTKRVRTWMRKTGRRFKKLRDRIVGKKSKKDRLKRQQDRVDRAAAAIRPPLEAMLRKGTSRTVLRLRFGWWRLRWWLSSLSDTGSGEITARINPSARVTRKAKIFIGAELERILIAAETEYFKKYAADGPSVSKNLQDARERLTAGRWDLPALSRAEQIVLLREIQAGHYPKLTPHVRGETPIKLRFGEGTFPVLDPKAVGKVGIETITVKDPKRMALFHVAMRPGGGKNLPNLPRNTLYPELVASMQRFGSGLGVSEATMMGLVRARTPDEFNTLAGAAMAGMNPAKAGEFQTQFIPHARALGLLTQAVEPARGGGLAAATSIAGAISTSPVDLMGRGGPGARLPEGPQGLLGPQEGRLGPITQQGAASQLDAERPNQAARDARTVYATPKTSADAEAFRHERDRQARIVRIFRELRAVAKRGALEGLAGADAAVLRLVGDKFKAWTNARVTGRGPKLEDAGNQLVAAVIAWLERYYG